MNLKIISDSCLTMFDEEVKDLNISIAPLSIVIDGIPELDNRSEEQVHNMLEKFKNGSTLTTSQPSPQEFLELFEKTVEENILVFTISDKLSGTFNSANIAKDLYEGEANIYVVNSYSAAMGMDILIDEALAQKDQMNFEQLCIHLDKFAKSVVSYLTIDDLKTLVRTGRLSKAQALIGGLLQVKPCLLLVDGAIVIKDKVRTSKKLVEYFCNEALQVAGNKNFRVYLTSIYSKELVQNIKIALETKSNKVRVVVKKDIGAVLAGHLGNGGVGMSIYVEEV